MPNGVPMAWLRGVVPPPAALRRLGAGGPVHRRRRLHDTPTSTSPTCRCSAATRPSRSCGRCAAAWRGATSSCCRPRTRSSCPRSSARRYAPPDVAVHAVGDAGQHRGDPGRARRSPAATRCCSSTASTTDTSTRRSSSSTTTAALVPEEGGLPADVTEHVRAGARSTTSTRSSGARGRGDVAVVITEPALTNNVGLLLPDDGFHAGLRDADPGDRHPARLRRDPYAGRRSGRAHRRCGASSPTS